MKKHLIIVSIIATVLSAGLAYLLFNTDLLVHTASPEMASINTLMKIMAGIAAIFLASLTTIIVYTLIFFRRRRGETGEGYSIRGNPRLELIWTLIPLLIVISLAGYAGIVLHEMEMPGPPDTELEINVLAFRFGWQFQYPEYGIQTFELGLPVDRRVVLQMQSRDVIHAFWVPQFGPKMDVVPGMTTTLRFTPTTIGQYTLECAELCGYGHTFMTAPVNVTSNEDFQNWVNSQPKVTPVPTLAPTQTTVSEPAPNNSVIDLAAQNIAFDNDTITVTAGVAVTVNFNNMDNGIPHNFAVYTDSSASNAIFRGEIINGPATITYTFTAPANPGTYYFQCDPHASIMNGQFVVQ